MATMLFGAIGTAIGGPICGSIASLIGGVGLGFAGRLFGRKQQDHSVKVTFGQRVDDVYLTGSAENASIRKLWGRMRLGGNVIWCSNFREWQENQVSFSPSASAGKGGGGGGGVIWQPNVTVVYHYNISFAVAFCEGGPGRSLGRVWADGKELDLSSFTWRFYDGSETQTPDPLIESIEGAGNVPAYRGTCYLVFEDNLQQKRLQATFAAHGGKTEIFCDEELITLSGATTNSSVQIPDGAIVLAVSNRVVTAITGATSYDCGDAANMRARPASWRRARSSVISWRKSKLFSKRMQNPNNGPGARVAYCHCGSRTTSAKREPRSSALRPLPIAKRVRQARHLTNNICACTRRSRGDGRMVRRRVGASSRTNEPAEREAILSRYRSELAAAYPRQPNKKALLRNPRLLWRFGRHENRVAEAYSLSIVANRFAPAS